jgi:RNA polymerase-binding transcription factor DksA
LKAPVKKSTLKTEESKQIVATKKETTAEKKSKASVGEKDIKPSKATLKTSRADDVSAPVVIPKTSTDKKVDYEPEFMKSVLDTPASAPASPTLKYSDSELQEFREIISRKLDAAKKELAYLQGLITRRDEMGGDETDNRYMTMEDGGMSMEREQLSQMASRQITFIDHLEKALMRIENKTYGICRVTGKLIDKARLRAVPHATLSMEAKLGIVK